MARAIRSYVTAVTVGLTDAVVLPATNSRRSIVITNNSGGQVNVNFGAPATASGPLQLRGNIPPVVLDHGLFGSILQQEIHMLASAAGTAVGLLTAEDCQMEALTYVSSQISGPITLGEPA